MPKLATWTCWVLGVLFVVAGVMTVVFGEPGDQHHNLLHLATGLVAVIAAVSRDRVTARIFCVVFGAGYLAFGVLGYLLGDPQSNRLWHVGVLHLAQAEHLFHIVLGGVVLAAGLLTAAPRPPANDAPRSTGRGATQQVVVGGLTAAAAGVVTMALSGVVFTTTIPPGLLILLVPAGLVALGRWRWPPVLAVVAALFIVVGYVPNGAAALLDPTGSGPFLGLWAQFVGASVALVAGTITVARTYRAAPKQAVESSDERQGGEPRADGEHDQLRTVPRPQRDHPPPQRALTPGVICATECYPLPVAGARVRDLAPRDVPGGSRAVRTPRDHEQAAGFASKHRPGEGVMSTERSESCGDRQRRGRRRT